jgi:hypothetical protein
VSRLIWILRVALLGLVAVLLLAWLTRVTGAIEVNKGYGYDGEHYARMIQIGFTVGTPSMRLRPVVLLINDEVNYHVFHDPLATFRAMNYVYAFALAVVLSGLCLHSGGTYLSAATLIVNVFLSIAVAKMFAFYPALVDLGAYAFLAAAVWAIVSGRRWLIVPATVLAVLSREFGAVAVLFGIVRDLRQRKPVPVVAATYAAPVAAFFWIRHVAASYSTGAQANEPVLSVSGVVAALWTNLAMWLDPAYAALWIYFFITLFGGISLLLLAAVRPIAASLRAEPEWLAIIVPIVIVTAVGYVDMWRYSAFLVAVLPPLWVWALGDVEPRRRWVLFVAVLLGTLATQRPWQHMDLRSYFSDWFPYYRFIENRPGAPSLLWPAWRYYAAVAATSLIVIGTVRMALAPKAGARGSDDVRSTARL